MWSQAWIGAWPWAKTVAMEAEVYVRQFGQPWADVWTRTEVAWAQAQTQARAPADMWRRLTAAQPNRTPGARKAEAERAAKAEASAHTEALALVGVYVWAQGQARASGQSLPSTLADAPTIGDILSDLNRHGLARGLWYYSREARDEYSCIIHFITPIARLPFELLRVIFFIIIDEARSPPSALMLVCKYWRAVVTNIWASINLGTRTPTDVVTKKLNRSQWLLDIVVDTDADRGDFTPSNGDFEAIFAVMKASSRWRSFVVESFPGPADLSEAVVNRGLQRCPNATMSRFTTFKVKSTCKTSPLLNGLLHILGRTAGSELTTMEINSANVLSFLAPTYASMFHSIRVLSLDTPGMPNPVDLLPNLHQLESFTASHISFPIYHNDVNLPFVHTLRHLRLKAVSIQWMSGRTFHVLEDCTLVFPLHHSILHTFSATPPNCKYLTFQGQPLEILGGIRAPELIKLSVISSGSFNRRGRRQLVRLSRQVLRESWLSPQILHISIEASTQAWILALTFMPYLEELVIESAKPSSLGARVFQSFTFRPNHISDMGTTSTFKEWCAPLCPSLKRFGLKYRRWVRRSEQFSLIPDFMSIIRSRERSLYALQSFSIWMTGNQEDPLELIEELRLSWTGLECLANESGIGKESFSWITHGDRGRQDERVTAFKINERPGDIDEQLALGEQFAALDLNDDCDSEYSQPDYGDSIEDNNGPECMDIESFTSGDEEGDEGGASGSRGGQIASSSGIYIMNLLLLERNRQKKRNRARQMLLDTPFDANISRRLREAEAEPEAVNFLLRGIFAHGISLTALKGEMTPREVAEFDVSAGTPRYHALLGRDRDGRTGEIVYCRLCSEDYQLYFKSPERALHHIMKDHLKTGYSCDCGW